MLDKERYLRFQFLTNRLIFFFPLNLFSFIAGESGRCLLFVWTGNCNWKRKRTFTNITNVVCPILSVCLHGRLGNIFVCCVFGVAYRYNDFCLVWFSRPNCIPAILSSLLFFFSNLFSLLTIYASLNFRHFAVVFLSYYFFISFLWVVFKVNMATIHFPDSALWKSTWTC